MKNRIILGIGLLLLFSGSYFTYDYFLDSLEPEQPQATKSNFLSDYNLTEGIWDQNPEKIKDIKI